MYKPNASTQKDYLQTRRRSCENVIVQWMAGLDESQLRYIAIDGKTLKGTARRDEHGPRVNTNRWGAENGLRLE